MGAGSLVDVTLFTKMLRRFGEYHTSKGMEMSINSLQIQ